MPYAHWAPPGRPVTGVRTHGPALTAVSALFFPPYLPANRALTHKAPCAPASLLGPCPAFVLYDAGTLVQKLIRVIIPCAEECLSSHSQFMFLPLDLSTLIPGVARCTQLLAGDHLSAELPLLLSM